MYKKFLVWLGIAVDDAMHEQPAPEPQTVQQLLNKLESVRDELYAEIEHINTQIEKCDGELDEAHVRREREIENANNRYKSVAESILAEQQQLQEDLSLVKLWLTDPEHASRS